MYWICLTKEELELLINWVGSSAWDLKQSQKTELLEEAEALAKLEEKLKFSLEHDK